MDKKIQDIENVDALIIEALDTDIELNMVCDGKLKNGTIEYNKETTYFSKERSDFPHYTFENGGIITDQKAPLKKKYLGNSPDIIPNKIKTHYKKFSANDIIPAKTIDTLYIDLNRDYASYEESIVKIYLPEQYSGKIVIACRDFYAENCKLPGEFQVKAESINIKNCDFPKSLFGIEGEGKESFIDQTTIKTIITQPPNQQTVNITSSSIESIIQNQYSRVYHFFDIKNSKVQEIRAKKTSIHGENSAIENLKIDPLQDEYSSKSVAVFQNVSLNHVEVKKTNLEYVNCKFKTGGRTTINKGKLLLFNKEYKLSRRFNKVYIKEEDKKIYTFEGKIKKKKIK